MTGYFHVFCFVCMFTVSCAYTAQKKDTKQPKKESANQTDNDLSSVLTQLGVEYQGLQPDGSMVVCQDSQKFGGDIYIASQVAQTLAMGKAMEADHARVTTQKGSTKTESSGELLGNNFIEKQGQRWACVKLVTEKITR